MKHFLFENLNFFFNEISEFSENLRKDRIFNYDINYLEYFELLIVGKFRMTDMI